MANEIDIVQLLALTVERNGSDLHLCAGSHPMVRVNGNLAPLSEMILDAGICRAFIYSILTEYQRARFEETLELDFALVVSNLGRFRCNAHFSRGVVEATFRYIPEQIPPLESLGLPPVVKRLCSLKQGLILITGIAGTGKTTTLAAMIEEINRSRTGVIVTIEDPIEYVFSHNLSRIKQREIGADTKSFPIALRHVLRQDPDVILVSEISDLETISAAISAAETGRLVLAALHSGDAPNAIDRIVDAFPKERQDQVVAQLVNSLQAVIVQRLLPKADGTGRVVCTEIMVMNEAVRSCLRDRRFQSILGMIELGGKDGMMTFDESVANLYSNGLISKDEALLNARDPNRINAVKPAKKGFFG